MHATHTEEKQRPCAYFSTHKTHALKEAVGKGEGGGGKGKQQDLCRRYGLLLASSSLSSSGSRKDREEKKRKWGPLQALRPPPRLPSARLAVGKTEREKKRKMGEGKDLCRRYGLILVFPRLV